MVWLVEVEGGGGGGAEAPLATMATGPPAGGDVWLGDEIEMGMPSQAGLPCDKRSTGSGGQSTPPFEPVSLLITMVAQSLSEVVPGLQ